MTDKHGERIVKTACTICYCGCGVLAHVKDGKVVKIEGDPEHPNNKGKLCPRGQAGIELLYHPDRLNYPLKRVGEKGEGKWQRILWDEALGTISDKLKEIKDEYGSEAITVANAAGLYSNFGISGHFAYLLDAPNMVGMDLICFGPVCAATRATIGYHAGMLDTEIVFSEILNSKCMLLWAANPRASAPYPVGEGIFKAKEDGAKLIVVDPSPTDYARIADLWLQIRPGTDDALALGMINVIINEVLYDKKFVDDWCFGFDMLKERVQQYPPGKVSQITWIPEKDIVAAARMFATIKPSCLCQRVPLDHSCNAVQTSRATFILTSICGNLDVKGGNPLPGPHPLKVETSLLLKADEIPQQIREKRIGAKEIPILSGADTIRGFVHPTLWTDAVMTGKPYPVKALIAMGNNWVVARQNSKRSWEALKKLDFMVVLDLFMTPTAELADIVLPACSWLERDGARGHSGHPYVIPIAHRAIEPLYERWDDVKILIEVAKRMGLDIPWQNLEEFIDGMFEPLGITFNDLKDKNFITIPKEYNRHEKGEFQFRTPSKKVELYSTFLEKYGYDPLPFYKAPPETTPEFPLVLMGGKRSMEYAHSAGRQLPMLRKRNPDPTIEMSPQAAKERGIKEGDWVWVETIYFGDKERVRFKAKLVEEFHLGVVCTENGWWFPEKKDPEHGCFESNINVVIPDDVYDPVYGSTNIKGVPCRVYKA